MKHTWIGAWAVVLVCGVFAGVAMSAGLITDRELRRDYSDKVNRGLPRMVDGETRLDTTSAGPGRLLTYFYTLVNVQVANVNVEEFKEKMSAQMLSRYCNDGRMKNVLANNITITHVYKDSAGQEIATLALTREACGI